MLLNEALKKYVAFARFENQGTTLVTYENHLRQMGIWMRNCELEQVKFQELINYINYIKQFGVQDGSLNSKCSAFKQFFTFYYKQGFKLFDPSLIPVPHAEPKFPKLIEKEDYFKLLEAAKGGKLINLRNQLILMLFWDTGVRRTELLSFETAKMDTTNLRTVIQTKKSRGIKPSRMIFWTKETNEILKEYIKLKPEGEALICSLWGENPGSRLGSMTLQDMIKGLSLKAELGYTANPHRFRHHFGRTLSQGGANGFTIGDMMGHANINSTRIYTVMNESALEETYNKHFRR